METIGLVVYSRSQAPAYPRSGAPLRNAPSRLCLILPNSFTYGNPSNYNIITFQSRHILSRRLSLHYT